MVRGSVPPTRSARAATIHLCHREIPDMRTPALLSAALLAGGLVTSASALAYGQGDLFTRFGIAKVDPKLSLIHI